MMPCPAHWPPYEAPFLHALPALADAEEAAYRDRLADQERLALTEIADLLREQDEEREDDDRERHEWDERGAL